MITGTEATERVDYAKGDPENPMSDEELTEKWQSLYDYTKTHSGMI
jgi:2-methylcitrate dehydratase PrpD